MRGISARDRSRRVVRFATHDCCTGVLRPGFRPSVGWATKPNAGIPTEINVGLHFIQPDLRVCATRHSRRDLPPPRPSTASGGGRQASHCAACANGKCRLGCKAQRGNPDRQESTLGFISFSPTYASALLGALDETRPPPQPPPPRAGAGDKRLIAPPAPMANVGWAAKPNAGIPIDRNQRWASFHSAQPTRLRHASSGRTAMVLRSPSASPNKAG
jgi:hypothetical protein